MPSPPVSSTPARAPLLRFGDFELDGDLLELRRKGVRKNLPPQPARLLLLLASRPDRAVTREEIRRTVWGDGAVVDFEHGMNACIRQVRAALGDQASNPRFIRTLPKRGYSFLGPVEVIEREPGAAPAPKTSSTPYGRRLPLALGVLAVAWFGARAWLRPEAIATPSDGRILLAVLPFDDADADADGYFADSLAEALIFRLARVEPVRLGVIARSSSAEAAARGLTIDEMGAQLGVEYVVEGSVRRGAERLSANVSLVQVADRASIWSDSIDVASADVPAFEDRVAAGVAAALRIDARSAPSDAVASDVPAARRTAAFDAYLRGRFEWNRFTAASLEASVRHYTGALELNPNLARARAALAESYALLPFHGVLTPDEAFPRAISVATEALGQDPELARAHNAIGFASLYYHHDWAAAAAAFERAIELDPGYAMAHHWHAGLLSVVGDHDAAVAEVRRALELDPLSLSLQSDLAWYLAYADRFDESIDEARKVLDRAPDDRWARYVLAVSLQRAGRTGDALGVIRELAAKRGGAAAQMQVDALDAAARDVFDTAWRLAFRPDDIELALTNDTPFQSAAGFALVGDAPASQALLERARRLDSGWLVFLRVDPRFDRLHGTAAFEELALRIGLSD